MYETLPKKFNNTWNLKVKLLSLVIKEFGIVVKNLKERIIALIILEKILVS